MNLHFWKMTFWISQGKVAGEVDKSLTQVFYVKVSRELTDRKLLKSVNFWPSYSKNKKVIVLGTRCSISCQLSVSIPDLPSCRIWLIRLQLMTHVWLKGSVRRWISCINEQSAKWRVKTISQEMFARNSATEHRSRVRGNAQLLHNCISNRIRKKLAISEEYNWRKFKIVRNVVIQQATHHVLSLAHTAIVMGWN